MKTFVGAAMMHVKKPDPLLNAQGKPVRVCQVCGTVSYSQAGVHPQCAQEQADAVRVARYKAESKAASRKDIAGAQPTSGPWQKSCPKCHTHLHVRKRRCACGYRFW